MRTVSAASVAAGQERIDELPCSVLESLGELAGAAKEGLLAMSVGVGLGVLHELLEAEVDEVVGAKGGNTGLGGPVEMKLRRRVDGIVSCCVLPASGSVAAARPFRLPPSVARSIPCHGAGGVARLAPGASVGHPCV